MLSVIFVIRLPYNSYLRISSINRSHSSVLQKTRHVQIAARMLFTPTIQQLLVACGRQRQPANPSVPHLQLVLTRIAWLYTLHACCVFGCIFGCRYRTCLIHATVQTTGCNTVKLTYILLCVPCQSATSEYSLPLPGSDSAPKSVVGLSHRVFHSRLKTHLFSRSFPP